MRGPFLFIFNFHPTDSHEGYRVGVEEAGEYQVQNELIWNFFLLSNVELNKIIPYSAVICLILSHKYTNSFKVIY